MSVEKEIDVRISRSKTGYPGWYVGIAADPRERLFTGHNVDEGGGAWFYKDAGTEFMAKAIEATFMKKGCKGAPAKGSSSHHVYAYRMTRTTRG